MGAHSIYAKDGKAARNIKPMKTVGDLKKRIADFPDNLPLLGYFGSKAKLTWFNVGMADEHLAFDEE